jgi:hypothetical protein
LIRKTSPGKRLGLLASGSYGGNSEREDGRSTVIVFWAIIWTLLGIWIILAAILLVPVSFSGQAGLDETASFEGTLAGAGSLVTLQAIATAGQPLELHLHLGRWARRWQLGNDLSWIGKLNPYLNRQVFKEVFRYLFQLERSLDLKLSFEGEIGLGDPDLNGCLSGFLGTLNTGQWECNLQPNLTETVLHFRGTMQGRLRPASLIWLTGRLLLSEPIRKIWRAQLRKTKPGRLL